MLKELKPNALPVINKAKYAGHYIICSASVSLLP